MKTFIALLPALAFLASASPLRLNGTSPVNDVTPSIKDVTLSAKASSDNDVSFEHLAGNTTTPGIGSLPTCAIPCIEIAVKTASDCELDDLACLCKQREKIARSAKKCILSTCGAKKAQSVYYHFFWHQEPKLTFYLEKVVPQVKAMCKAYDKKEEERRKEEKKKEKEQEEARKKAEKEQKERDKKQREEEKKKEKEEKKKQKEKEKEEERKKKEEEKKKKEEQKEWERLQKEEEKRKKEEEKKKKEEEKRKKKEKEEAEAGENNEKRDETEERGEPEFTLEM